MDITAEEREQIGQVVWATWTDWVKEHPDMPDLDTWPATWEALSEDGREFARCIGAAIARQERLYRAIRQQIGPYGCISANSLADSMGLERAALAPGGAWDTALQALVQFGRIRPVEGLARVYFIPAGAPGPISIGETRYSMWETR